MKIDVQSCWKKMRLRINFYTRVFLCLQFFTLGVRAFNKYNVSLDLLKYCNEHLVSGEYGYHNYYNIKSLNHMELGENETLHLKLFVSTDSDAHVLLSKDVPSMANKVYEIVIGGWINRRSVLRFGKQEGPEIVKTDNDPYLLWIFDITPIEIIQTKEGRLQVFIPGYKEEPILDYLDPSPLDINYLSFSTYRGYKGRWLYDCDMSGEEKERQKQKASLKKDSVLGDSSRQRKNETLCLKSAYFQFNMNLLTADFDYQKMKGRLNIFLNSTGNEVVLGNNIDLITECVKNLKECPASEYLCNISKIEVRPISEKNVVPTIRLDRN